MASSDEVDESIISVSLKDGSIVKYLMRGLTSDEIEPWADFCASVFAYKATPPPASYFQRHFDNDPTRDASLIRVMLYEGKVVSSCRIFQRQVSSFQGGVFAGGIGEVCTDKDHRKRGLSKLLLQNAIQIMVSRGMKLTLLHAAPEFRPVYEKGGGYQCVTSQWSVVTLVRSNLKEAVIPYMTRLAKFPQDTARLQEIHQQYSERRFDGCIIRSQDYWNEYISKELDGSLWTLVKDDSLVAWVSLRFKGQRYQMRDFGCHVESTSVSDALSMLLIVALQDIDEEQVSLYLPTGVLDDMTKHDCPFIDWSTVVIENDDGWMYKTLQQDESSMMAATKTRNHLIWPADSF